MIFPYVFHSLYSLVLTANRACVYTGSIGPRKACPADLSSFCSASSALFQCTSLIFTRGTQHRKGRYNRVFIRRKNKSGSA